MDLNLHTSIMVVAAILVLLILVDGLKRVLAARAEHKRLLANDAFAAKEDLDLLKAELPNGGARSVDEADSQSNLDKQDPPYARPLSRTESRAYRPESTGKTLKSIDADTLKSTQAKSAEPMLEGNQRPPKFKSNAEAEPHARPDLTVKSKPLQKGNVVSHSRSARLQDKINLSVGVSVQGIDGAAASLGDPAELTDVCTQGHVPLLMESVQLGALSEKRDQASIEQFNADADGAALEGALKDTLEVTKRQSTENQAEEVASVSHSIKKSSAVAQNEAKKTPVLNASIPRDPLFDDFDELDITASSPTQKATTTQITAGVGERLADRPPSEEVLVIHVFSKQAAGFEHKQLFALFKACDLRFGEMSIFHRFERANAQGKIQFSVADVVKPGAFNLDQTHRTPGIALFMSLPGPEKPIEAFDAMAEVARAVARNLEGVVKDEMLSVMTTQTLEHCRQRIHEFNRRQQLAKPSFA